MLRNNADARRCSYFELGLPVSLLAYGDWDSVILSGLPCFAPSYYVGEPDTFAALNNVENRTRVTVQ